MIWQYWEVGHLEGDKVRRTPPSPMGLMTLQNARNTVICPFAILLSVIWRDTRRQAEKEISPDIWILGFWASRTNCEKYTFVAYQLPTGNKFVIIAEKEQGIFN
jgi:hypothetical protein